MAKYTYILSINTFFIGLITFAASCSAMDYNLSFRPSYSRYDEAEYITRKAGSMIQQVEMCLTCVALTLGKMGQPEYARLSETLGRTLTQQYEHMQKWFAFLQTNRELRIDDTTIMKELRKSFELAVQVEEKIKGLAQELCLMPATPEIGHRKVE